MTLTLLKRPKPQSKKVFSQMLLRRTSQKQMTQLVFESNFDYLI